MDKRLNQMIWCDEIVAVQSGNSYFKYALTQDALSTKIQTALDSGQFERANPKPYKITVRKALENSKAKPAFHDDPGKLFNPPVTLPT